MGPLADERGVAVTVLKDLGVADQARERVREVMALRRTRALTSFRFSS
jgi:hypothetical protein